LVTSGVDIDILLTERIVADVYCPGDTIQEFITYLFLLSDNNKL
jgi:hypothetical protein